MSSKTWRDVQITLPQENTPVLVVTIHDEYPFIAGFDGDIFYEWHTSQPLHDVVMWMHFPKLPYE